MTIQIVSSGVHSSGLNVGSGNELLVLSGGRTISTTVLSGGVERLSSGALVESVTVSGGGVLVGPGAANLTTVDYGLVSGVTMSGSIEAYLVVMSGGVARGNLLTKNASEFVHSGGVAIGDMVGKGGQQLIASGGKTSGASIVGGGALEDDGGFVSGARISSGGAIRVFAGTVSNVVVSNGGWEIISTAAVVSGDTVLSGAALYFDGDIKSGQTLAVPASIASTTMLDGVTLSSGAALQIDVVRVLSGGVLSLTTGTSAFDVIVSAGGALLGVGAAQDVFQDFGLVSGVLLSGGNVESGGVVSDVRLLGELQISRGGVARGVVVTSGSLNDMGVLSGALVSSGGLLLVSGRASGDVISSGGEEFIGSGAVISGDVVMAGGKLALGGPIRAGQTIIFRESVASTTVIDGATLSAGASIECAGATVLSGGVASLTFEETRDNFVNVQAGGTLLGPGGVGIIFNSGLVSGVFVNSGSLFVDAGGVVSGIRVGIGGTETVSAGGVDRGGTTVARGGQLLVRSGGKVEGTTIVAGGTLRVAAGAAISGGLSILGGEAVIAGTMGAGQIVGFTGAGGVLQLNSLTGFQAMISGLHSAAQKIDMHGFIFSSGETATWAQSGTSGTLTVTDGDNSASLILIGTYATSDFKLSRDGHGGTFVFDPQAASPATTPAPATTRFIETVAGFHDGRGQAGPDAVQAGGSALLSGAPLMTAATSGR